MHKLMESFELTVNGHSHVVEADPEMPLLWVIRDILGLTGTKFGCGGGFCGSCTVHMDGVAVRSCITPVASVTDQEITTIEGLSEDGHHPLQIAWDEHDVSQCGYCQVGQIMNAAAWMKDTPNPSDEDIDRLQAGNLCRCGTYTRIRTAIKRAAEIAGD
jgi:isoquinoline 1-oxidoreductase alpha subunit